MRIPKVVCMAVVLSLLILALVPAAARAQAGAAGVDRPYHLHDKVQVNARGVGWMDGSQYDFPIDINDDGTIDTPEGELKKKGS